MANSIPSRMAGLFLVLAAGLCGENMQNAWRIFRRDRFNHASPNSAQTESAAAGALEIQLAGNAYYFGKLYEKPTIGDPVREVSISDIPRVNRLMYYGGGLAIILFALLHTAAVSLIMLI